MLRSQAVVRPLMAENLQKQPNLKNLDFSGFVSLKFVKAPPKTGSRNEITAAVMPHLQAVVHVCSLAQLP